MQAIYGYGRPKLFCPEDVDYCHYQSPNVLLKEIGMDKENYWIDMAYLCCAAIFFRTAAFCALKRRLRVI